MPQQTVYIRNGDMEKWKALENKAAWISAHLEDEGTPLSMSNLRMVKNDPGLNLCKVHNIPLTMYGKCLQKGCKYA